MSRTDLYTTGSKRAKLPRKRKKAAIKAQGRAWYHGTIKLHNTLAKDGKAEKICKFWVNSSVRDVPHIKNGYPIMIPTPHKFW